MKFKRIPAVFAAVAMIASMTACEGKSEKSGSEGKTESGDNANIETEASENEDSSNISGETIYWMSEYDINPSGSQGRSVALTLFEDVYGGKVEWIPTTRETRSDDLSNRILSGEPVDMVPFTSDVIPDGISKEQYQPLDDYIDLNDELWSDVKGLADKMAYDGKHYVIPYGISNPSFLIYSRKMIKDEKLDDPYKLYESGKWDWDAFTDMMNKFVDNADGETRYGCAGQFSKPLVQSTGQGFVNFDGKTFSSNLSSPEIEKAELLVEEINQQDLFDYTWYTSFPDDGSVLFYAMSPWALAESNAKNPDEDIFIVPYPKMPNTDDYYTCADIDAKMLAANSDKGQAVAKYLECERIALLEDKYTEAAKKKALEKTKSPGGDELFITEEQYNAILAMTDPAEASLVYDFGYGMGSEMSAQLYDYSKRGAVNNLYDAIVSEYEGAPGSWDELRDEWKSVVEDAVKKYN